MTDMLTLRFSWMSNDQVNNIKLLLDNQSQNNQENNIEFLEDKQNDDVLSSIQEIINTRLNNKIISNQIRLKKLLAPADKDKIEKLHLLRLLYLKCRALPLASKILATSFMILSIGAIIAGAIFCPPSLAVTIPLLGKFALSALIMIIAGATIKATILGLTIHIACKKPSVKSDTRIDNDKLEKLKTHLNKVTHPGYTNMKTNQKVTAALKGNENWQNMLQPLKEQDQNNEPKNKEELNYQPQPLNQDTENFKQQLQTLSAENQHLKTQKTQEIKQLKQEQQSLREENQQLKAQLKLSQQQNQKVESLEQQP